MNSDGQPCLSFRWLLKSTPLPNAIEGRTKLPRCFPTDSGRIYLDGCYLRYNNHEFFEEPLNRFLDTVKCGHAGAVTSDQYVRREFAKKGL